ncbi:uncharacterized protein LOC110381326 [Helicoverpa armigera]|uniref:uncharacterized protein LOC110381326 n=1 Tax=Helicoverpa armigera TaxID=29058 RepID=UPI0030839E23
MKVFCVFLLVSFSYGLPTDSKGTKLSAPNLTRLTAMESDGGYSERINWDAVVSDDASDPVVGYKVNIWEVKKIKSTKYSYVNGTLQKREEEIEPPIDFDNGPEGTPTVLLTPANQTEVTFNIKLHVTYEIRIQAYTKNIDGPLSSPDRIQLD